MSLNLKGMDWYRYFKVKKFKPTLFKGMVEDADGQYIDIYVHKLYRYEFKGYVDELIELAHEKGAIGVHEIESFTEDFIRKGILEKELAV
jgi:hypothetical protein